MLCNFLNKISFKENRRRYLNLKGIASKRYAYKGPDIVQIDLTDKCNSACLLCWKHSPYIKGQVFSESLDFSETKKFIEEISGMGTVELIFSGGGEPFCYDKIWQVLEWTQKRHLNFHINTNFTLLKKEDIKRLLGFNRLSSLTISLWAATPELYYKLHGRSKSLFHELVDSIKFLNYIKPPNLYVKIMAVISNINYAYLRDLSDLAHKTGCNNLEFDIYDVIPGITDKFLLDKAQIAALRMNFEELDGYIRRKGYKVNIINKKLFLKRLLSPGACSGSYDTDAEKTPCYSGWIFLRLRANGDFNSCLKSHRIPIGNLYKEKVLSVWNNPLQQEFRKNALSIPKNRGYFSLIGNGNDDKVGCGRICDNIIANKNLHRLARFLK